MHLLCIKYVFVIRYVYGNELLVSGRHIFKHFNDCKDCDTYLCPELINNILSLDVIKVVTRLKSDIFLIQNGNYLKNMCFRCKA